MDAVLLNIIGSVPLVTKIWAIGCISLSLLTTTNVLDPAKTIYSFDLVFKKGHYERIVYSLFDYGQFDWASIFNIFMNINHLTVLENSFALKRRYCWIVTLMLVSIIAISSLEQPIPSLGIILHENLVYYQIRKNGDDLQFRLLGVFEVSPLMVRFYVDVMMLVVFRRSWLQVCMNFIPGHLLYYMDETVHDIYGIDLCKTPYDWWLDSRRQSAR
ncbi:hypothetical protein HG536_0D01110 [Torulaspora globosa]|uniref:Derlin n=1 Tax=Torulaspora globosa TaxID=48254 RepID=A0A7G3ZGF3_9SACH|nr:uncharacterized protein HG536_0D01110 [Torulaspora globosa]QLL32589.1 hypothetical protein HG536_0D01110 [Torulaspora globosa]